MALASYNVGLGHLEDARILTQQQGGDADKWVDVKKYLPLLAKKEWYEKTKHGYARGYEPVKYVTNIRLYYDLLKRMELGKTPIEETIDNTGDTLNIELQAL
jgi:membrane-bound lytic murein transglycosylase F